MALGRIMKEKKVNTRTLAEKTGIDYGYLTQIRAGYRYCSNEKWKRIADALGINVLDLLYPEDSRDIDAKVSERNHDESTNSIITTG